ncbi:hypothetical protein GGF46_002457 [Coemansia sp. RSA 552]|nr:hypothetical protein GGF46_002457 [Coemansia sp. RSA 552]
MRLSWVLSAVAVIGVAFTLAAAHPVGSADLTPGTVEWSGGGLAKRQSSETQDQLKRIYCPRRNCQGGRYWLTMQPSAAAGWAVGSIAFLAGGVLIQFRSSFTCFAMTELGISLFLRAGLNYEKGNKTSIYIASIFFNLHAAVILFVNFMAGVFSLKAMFDEAKAVRAPLVTIFTLVLNAAMFSMLVAGVVIMFRDETMTEVNAGWRLLQAIYYIVVIVMGLAIPLLVKYLFDGGGGAGLIVASAAALLAVLLLALWGSYMLSRTYLPLDNKVWTSEGMFYGLNIVPLLVIGIIF